MAVPQDENDKAYANSLFLLDDDNYYLKSKNYLENEYIKIGGYNTYKQPDNPIVNISNIVAISPDGKVWKTDGKNLINVYEFSSKEGTVGSGDNAITNSLTPEQVKQSYISQLIPNLKTTTTEKGFKLDLNNSIINGYDLYLKGTNITTKKSFILDSSAPDIPFRINNDKFNVSWDGVLTCTKINSLSNDGTTDKAISINDNFYVTKGGAAGGGSANFNSGSFGGLSAGGMSLGGKKLNCSSHNIVKSVKLSMGSFGIGGDTGGGIGVVKGLTYGGTYILKSNSKSITVKGTCSIKVDGKPKSGTCSVTIPLTYFQYVNGSEGGVINASVEKLSENYVSWS